MNALNSAMIDSMDSALNDAESDEDIHVVVLKGAGRAFCAGADIGAGGASASQGERWTATNSSVYDDMVAFTTQRRVSTWSMRKPVIAQVHGYCIAAGHDLAAQCDIIIAAESTKFIHPEVRRLGVTWRHMSAYYAGPQWAKIMMFTGDPISGTQAERIGLVAKAVPDDLLEEEVAKLAARIALVPVEILALNKATINKAVEGMGLGPYLEYGGIMDALAHSTSSFRAFMEQVRSEGLASALETQDRDFRRLPMPFQTDGSSRD